MATITSSLNLERTADVAIDGDTTIALATGIEVLRITSAANTPRVAAITGGTNKRLFLLMNCSGLTVQIINQSPPTNSITIWRGTASKSIQPGEGSWIWFDGVAGYWRQLD